jgi:hypothetical protein
MKAFSKISVIAVLLVILSVSCLKKNEYPVEPVIEFKSYSVQQASDGTDSIGYLSINYTDGDGDIGLSANQTTGQYQYDFFLKLLREKNGGLEEVILPDTSSSFNARIPVLTPSGSNKNIRGVITIAIGLTYARNYILSNGIAFDVSIEDQAMHKSNLIRTPVFPYKY